MKILALDSGLERTGYAVFKKNSDAKLLSYGCIETDKSQTLAKRLLILGQKVKKIIESSKPDLMILEQVFFSKNVKTAIQVAQAQGSTILIAAQNGVPVEFITPSEVKQAVTGFGGSDKKSVGKMIQLTLHLPVLPKPDDVVDAIACGLAYCVYKRYDREN